MKPASMMRRHKTWEPLWQVTPLPISEQLIADNMKPTEAFPNGHSREKVIEDLRREEETTTLWTNHIYQVQRRELPEHGLVHLNIRRRDGAPILRDWRHFQWIKNQLVGEECEGIELYPAESRLTDTSNKYHIYCSTDPTFRFPIYMFNKRDVNYDDPGSTPGTRQRTL